MKKKEKKAPIKREKSIALSYWRELEKLALKYVSLKIGDDIERTERLTDPKNDGGFDGEVIISFGNALCHKILLEAKMRSSNKKLNLHDCSKAVIIAFNRAANTLYLFTNTHFSPQVIRELNDFEKKINLHMILINGENLKQFIVEHVSELEKTDIDSEFLKLMSESNITTLAVNSLKHELYHIGNIDYKILNLTPKVENVIGVERVKMTDKIFNALKASINICSIEGRVGIGKSIITQNVMKNLERYGHATYTIDLQLCNSQRVLFLRIIQSIWGVNLFHMIEDDKIKNTLDEMLILPDGKILSDEIRDAIVQLLIWDEKIYSNHEDKFSYLLIQFLKSILEAHKGKLNIAFAIVNLNKSRYEIIDFLMSIIKVLNDVEVKVIIEIKTPFDIENENDKSQSNYYYKGLKNISLKQNGYVVPDLDNKDILEYTNTLLPGIDGEICRRLVSRLSNTPLFLTIAIIQIKKALNIEMVDDIYRFKLDEAIENLDISSATVLSNTIKLYNNNTYLDSFEAFSLLNGRFPIELLNCLFMNEGTEIIAEELLDTAMIDLIGNELIVKNNIYYDLFCDISRVIKRKRVAQTIYKNIDILNYDQEKKECTKVDLLYCFEKPEISIYRVKDMADKMKMLKKFKKAIDYYDKVITLYESMNNCIDKSFDIIEILFDIINCGTMIHINSNIKFEKYLDLLEEKISFIMNKEDKVRKEIRLTVLKWHKLFTSGNIEDSYVLIKETIHVLDKVDFEVDDELGGEVYTAYALSVKEFYSNEDALFIFEKALRIYQNSITLKAEYLSHIGNSNMKNNPSKAVTNYSMLIDITKDSWYSTNDILHARIDLANALFLSHEYEKASSNAMVALEISKTNGYVFQEGRALNLIGCCYNIQENTKVAKNKLNESIYLLNYSEAHIYSWRAKANLVGIYYYENNIEKAFQLSDEILEQLIGQFMNKIINDYDSAVHGVVLLLLYYYKKMNNEDGVNKALSQIDNIKFENKLNKLSKLKSIDGIFEGKAQILNNLIFVLG